MLRLLKLSAISVHNAFPTVQHSRLNCTLCNRRYGFILGSKSRYRRQQRYLSSSSISFQKNLLRKRTSGRGNTYSKILGVSSKGLGEREAKVTTFCLEGATSTSVNDVRAELTERLETNSSSNSEAKEMLEELKEMEEEGQRGQEFLIEAMPINAELVQTSLIENNVNTSVKNSKKLKLIRDKLNKIKYMELNKAGKETSFNYSLLSYINMCINCGFMNRCWSTLSYYLEKSIVPINDVQVMNMLMEGYARGGNLDKLMEVWSILDSKNMRPSEMSFAHRFEAIARSAKRDKHELLLSCFKDMTSMGITLDNIFNKCVWKKNSREVILQAIRVIRPNYSPNIELPDVFYSNTLVNALNECDTSLMNSPAEGLFTLNDVNNLFDTQVKMETNTFVEIKSIEKEAEPSETLTYYRKKLNEMTALWDKIITSSLKRDLATLNTQHKFMHKSFRQLNIYPYLVYLDQNQYKEIILEEIRKLAEGSETYSPSSVHLYRELGNKVRIRCEVKQKKADGVLEQTKHLYNKYFDWYMNPSKYKYVNSRMCWQMLKYKHQEGPTIDKDVDAWPASVLIGVGQFLYSIILKDIKIDVNVMKMNSNQEHLLPAFYTVFRYHGFAIKEEVKPHPILSKIFRAARLPYLKFSVTDVPMMAPPIPWSTRSSGGYIIPKTSLIRLPHEAIQQLDRLKNSPLPQIYPCLDALNQLSMVPWKVNTPVLDIIINIFNNGGSSKLEIPEPPAALPLPKPVSSINSTERFHAFRKRMVVRRKRAEMYSLWCDALYRLSLANHFRDKVFWLPHNMDFRGRVYPCPPHLNHLGSDLARSILKFAKGEPLGPDGLGWLKIHLVNLTGLKKRDSNAERLKYADEILPKILDSANNPLEGEKWWMDSEEPCQTLACCMEIRNALANETGPENYISHFPVHQDGSCNGLQHYAALGRDSVGAYSVNLSPAEVPQDVYSCVAAIVERERIKDAKEGVQIAQVLEGYVKRKVIKQTVMTTVYGVTRFGARLQIAKQLKDIEEFPKEHVWTASTYLVTKTFISLREMFTSAREIQDWLTETAKYISQFCGQNVEYVTPLGLPVVQPYAKHKDKIHLKKSSSSNFQEYFPLDMFERPNVIKQRNAFPPNFIHSLDSCHMMLTSLFCERAGITFVSVHDCYWTHPKTLPQMNKICREQFVALHSQPILNNLSEYMLQKFRCLEKDEMFEDPSLVNLTQERLNSLLKQLPKKGDFDLNNVLNSEYFFS
ncbi:DNA-directed RNA polymerase, mitochondrial [Cimex lectularius]|uniref:DNA-directed RNA polymerase n=1 Tax=Cimex lectularius TaxID=79782 RepID=A0A8I6S9I4_CIMLE|nr:DNA-directed RNA polymerase, mitochondrial [Cimex lectularius]